MTDDTIRATRVIRDLATYDGRCVYTQPLHRPARVQYGKLTIRDVKVQFEDGVEMPMTALFAAMYARGPRLDAPDVPLRCVQPGVWESEVMEDFECEELVYVLAPSLMARHAPVVP